MSDHVPEHTIQRRYSYRFCRPVRFLVAGIFCLTVFSCSGPKNYPEPPRQGDHLFIDASLIQKDIPVFFSYRTKATTANFFVLKNDKGIVSFHDACETCYPKKRGYRLQEGLLVCNACNQRFTKESIITGLGGCYPIRLDGRETEGGYLVSIAELERQAARR